MKIQIFKILVLLIISFILCQVLLINNIGTGLSIIISHVLAVIVFLIVNKKIFSDDKLKLITIIILFLSSFWIFGSSTALIAIYLLTILFHILDSKDYFENKYKFIIISIILFATTTIITRFITIEINSENSLYFELTYIISIIVCLFFMIKKIHITNLKALYYTLSIFLIITSLIYIVRIYNLVELKNVGENTIEILEEVQYKNTKKDIKPILEAADNQLSPVVEGIDTTNNNKTLLIETTAGKYWYKTVDALIQSLISVFNKQQNTVSDIKEETLKLTEFLSSWVRNMIEPTIEYLIMAFITNVICVLTVVYVVKNNYEYNSF